MKSLSIVVVALVIATGCAHSPRAPKTANPEEIERVKQRAANDLNCPAESVTVGVLQQGGMMTPWTFSAKGCDKTATYLSRAGTIIRN